MSKMKSILMMSALMCVSSMPEPSLFDEPRQREPEKPNKHPKPKILLSRMEDIPKGHSLHSDFGIFKRDKNTVQIYYEYTGSSTKSLFKSKQLKFNEIQEWLDYLTDEEIVENGYVITAGEV